MELCCSPQGVRAPSHDLAVRTPASRSGCYAAAIVWPIAGAPDGSFYFDNQPKMLDQFLVNKSMAIGDAKIKVDPATVQIFPAASVGQSMCIPEARGQSRTDSPTTPHHASRVDRAKLGRPRSGARRKPSGP